MRELACALERWEAVIGLEIHTELTELETKMFCGCRITHDEAPNSNVCPVCLGFPGALPVPNKRAIESIVMAGLATNCEIRRRSMFYRKHYFYPDMAKNFQTTQGPIALCMHGRLDLEVPASAAAERGDLAGEPHGEAIVASKARGASAGEHGFRPTGYGASAPLAPERRPDGSYIAPIRILRIHMEEDAAKMVHIGGAEGRITEAHESLIDYNRCGTPLIELVTLPDLRTPEEARLFMEELRRIFIALRISDCSMESGSMRCDANVSLRPRGSTELGVKTELKNLNSFKSLHDGLAYEIRRQADVLEQGGTVYQETRHWEPARKRTVVMRVKESADDYRLFPDPDLAPFALADEFIEACRKRLPELPQALRDRLVTQFGIRRADAAQIASDADLARFFERAAANCDRLRAQTIANLLLNEVVSYLKAARTPLAESGIAPERLCALAALVEDETISYSRVPEVIEVMARTGEDPGAIADARGIRQVNDDACLEPVVEEVLRACPGQIAQYRAGNERVLGFLIGQCMKASRGTGNPRRFGELLRASLA
ncbi:aspartyl/glutamyl-tRNA(Asn/Gln) amidotransferase subunit B [Coriobacterium glomerans PW2]|uniref:Aspartyl/glutamyl-tRNA(Asn/Gln) amidotransferase subunit B n=1 Tax=Coriobacterium glomerans (strain ATCC 49209 / DSM 20642 / JCM 10262 / PW2) TaxID=700015 RepID=F2NAS9_CORGP|nr:Asp-tRNA(Asn)/Glu-tRNA(Gln) amidotransferase subunit GatB [Coriobacterium glomerans]AEB07535.1 aspartyl/glutamyl-tRNA(Asn/Gln) amidotransferase subunit B [Coriobacterium glomerans PW2]